MVMRWWMLLQNGWRNNESLLLDLLFHWTGRRLFDWEAQMSMDQDEKQEYECLILEGFSPQDARAKARGANDKINSRRLSGPMTGDTKNGHGDRPLISDHRSDGWSERVSLGADSRTPDEQQLDWLSNDWAAGIILDIQGVLTEKQYRFLQNKFGLDGVEPARSVNDLAERLGVKPQTAQSMMKVIRKKVVRKLGVQYGYAA